MAASPIMKQLDRVLALGLTPLLRSRGFSRQTSRRYRFDGASYCSLLEIQVSEHGLSSSTAGYYVNCGIYFPALDQYCYGTFSDKRLDEPGCHLRARIGTYLAEDVATIMPLEWCSISTRKAPNKSAVLLATAVERFALPWLLRPWTIEDFVRESRRASELRISTRFEAAELAASALALADSQQAAITHLQQYLGTLSRTAGQWEYLHKWAAGKGMSLANRP